MDIINIEALQYRWENLLQPFPIEPLVSQRVFFDLVAAYSSDGRFYHTLKHIEQVLEKIEEIEIQMQPIQLRSHKINFAAIQFAAWFHDVIYNPQLKDNEEKSAAFAGSILTQFNLPINIINFVKSLILKTKNHQSLTADLHSQILLDADLAILGASELEYQAYAQEIRQEYSWLTEQVYCLGRRQVLQGFLKRQRIYYTQQIFLNLELKARLNIESELAALLSTP